ALKIFYKTSGTKLLNETLERLEGHWKTLPRQDNSADLIPTGTTSFTTYSTPVPDGEGSIYALKKDLDSPTRLVRVDAATGGEKRLARLGEVNTGLVRVGDKLWWTEYRQSTLWEQRVNSQLRYYDLATGKQGAVKGTGRVIFPTESREGDEPAYIEYDRTGFYSIVTPSFRYDLSDSLSVHGFSYDRLTDAYYFLALSDCGMWIGTPNEKTRVADIFMVTPPTYAALSDLRASDGKLYYTSIVSGRDEAHMFDPAQGKNYRITASRFGSFSPAPVPGTGDFTVITYTSEGYMLALQKGSASPMEEVPAGAAPLNLFNPAKVTWDVMNIDTVKLGSGDKGRKVGRYRKFPHQLQFHSWSPFWFDPEGLLEEDRLNIYIGATAFSQNLLNSTVTTLGYKYTDRGSLFNAGLNFYGLPVKFAVDAEYGTMSQSVSIPSNVIILGGLPLKNHFRIYGRAYLPLLLSSGYNIRWLTPSFDIEHQNVYYYKPSADSRFLTGTGIQKFRFSVTYSENVRMAHRDFLPRFGYAVRISNTFTPLNDYYGGIASLYGRVYLPGILPHNSLMIRGALQKQSTALYNFRQKDIFPRGAHYSVAPDRYGAFAVDYQFPFWYPDGGINSVVYFKRIRANVFYDRARFRHVSGSWDAADKKVTITGKQWGSIYSYGLELTFDIVPFRLPASTDTSFTLSVYRPSDHNKPVFSAGLVLPL
ncbi:MAG: hypothetical protein LUE10_04730, partial [Alistipes sp.]|nr:hypothetical protein [Alistipes sp.]